MFTLLLLNSCDCAGLLRFLFSVGGDGERMVPSEGLNGGSPAGSRIYFVHIFCEVFWRARSEVQVGRWESSNYFPQSGGGGALSPGTVIAKVYWVGLGRQRGAERWTFLRL